MPDGEVLSDTTPIIGRLERDWRGRSVYPTAPGMRFLNSLLEDYADEWNTKHMFHYRWWFEKDTRTAAAILPTFADHTIAQERYEAFRDYICERQVRRVSAVTGSNSVTAPVIEDSYVRMLACLEAHLAAGNRFLLGDRPSSADFGFFGQFTCLTQFDPTPSNLAVEIAPRVVGYTFFLEDCSGMSPKQADWATEVCPTLKAVLVEAGRLYAPWMVANAQACAAGAKEVNTELDGKPFVANSFVYQAKCLKWLCTEYGELDVVDRRFVDKALEGTGLEVMFRPEMAPSKL
eukprot:TRINITY_DN44841_c0_g1_i1.p1 TRINITY_DN44841_c0_g1~~TRINITY_DN44841_c0_g1_i1.p1  ORF type:complete len:290 (+),score=70.48 TRINITY_DN44841_c0_g1_i1:290-1159(+)